MTTYDPASGLRVPTRDDDLERRTSLLHELGLLDVESDSELDEIAGFLGEAAGQPWAMVNFITDQQRFPGLYVAPDALPVARSMPLTHGYCPDVLHRPVAMVLPHLHSHPRLKSNPVVDGLGVLTYSGAPLIHHQLGLCFGTVCFIGDAPMDQSTGQRSLAQVNAARDEALAVIDRRARERGLL
ncbi:GAF domain-containing protein [Actinacidiphila sp. bgisy144]|uniref:GAF domain-containing protein n=1 Tax=Actinacidiphila sp. bgisy144 TaxID=3413791 RepID=UPI003EBA4C3F